MGHGRREENVCSIPLVLCMEKVLANAEDIQERDEIQSIRLHYWVHSTVAVNEDFAVV